MSPADDDGAHGRGTGRTSVMLLDGQVRETSIAAAAKTLTLCKQRPLHSEGKNSDSDSGIIAGVCADNPYCSSQINFIVFGVLSTLL